MENFINAISSEQDMNIDHWLYLKGNIHNLDQIANKLAQLSSISTQNIRLLISNMMLKSILKMYMSNILQKFLSWYNAYSYNFENNEVRHLFKLYLDKLIELNDKTILNKVINTIYHDLTSRVQRYNEQQINEIRECLNLWPKDITNIIEVTLKHGDKKGIYTTHIKVITYLLMNHVTPYIYSKRKKIVSMVKNYKKINLECPILNQIVRTLSI